jgi:hypothetical protein
VSPGGYGVEEGLTKGTKTVHNTSRLMRLCLNKVLRQGESRVRREVGDGNRNGYEE